MTAASLGPLSSPPTTRHVVVMGVSGCGKSTVAAALAERLGYVLGDADAFHPQANIDKMSAGIPLTDADRESWLRSLAAWMVSQAAAGRSTVMACSALRRAYRDVLRTGPPSLDFAHLDGPSEVIRARMAAREDHFMPTTLLDSQIATLEPLGADEPGVTLDLSLSPTELVTQIVAALDLPSTR